MNALEVILALIGIIGGLISLINALAKRHKMAIQVSSILMMVVGAVVIIGHLLKDKRIYQLPNDQIGMAFLTAVFLVITGALFYLVSLHINFKK